MIGASYSPGTSPPNFFQGVGKIDVYDLLIAASEQKIDRPKGGQQNYFYVII
jgi:hypothetical protein